MAYLLSAPIDFQGQKDVEKYTHTLLIFTGVTAFLIGFINQNLALTMGIMGGGLAVVFLLGLPPWPIYKQHPVKWLPKSTAAGEAQREKTVWKQVLGVIGL
ncbi:hypothetical protein SmJEL517_g02583 [Synchytrium microbalum]|uniref:Signal peptidase complex subunit 1 n=1 Tax=Synchytrium microbalum TaxID=1806994 RepID=A0A507C688_9FUNG|nr:uncharacterized protein SmJEL517_g02583 [Synchytrium microbalum]TPX34858.1 hypothetical protein SmJEL517_g02583 [Synchytrium microbalum]